MLLRLPESLIRNQKQEEKATFCNLVHSSQRRTYMHIRPLKSWSICNPPAIAEEAVPTKAPIIYTESAPSFVVWPRGRPHHHSRPLFPQSDQRTRCSQGLRQSQQSAA